MTLHREFKESTVRITHYISIRHFGPYEEVNATWARLTQFAFEYGASGPDVVAFGFCHDCGPHTPPEEIRYDACLGVDPKFHKSLMEKMADSKDGDFEGIRLETMSVGKTIMTVHRGPYSTIREAYTDALRAAATQKLSFDAHRLPTLEVYRNNPLLTKPESLLTEIHFLHKGSTPRVD